MRNTHYLTKQFYNSKAQDYSTTCPTSEQISRGAEETVKRIDSVLQCLLTVPDTDTVA